MSDSKKTPKARQTRKKRDLGIYSKNVLTRKVFLPFNVIGSNIIENISGDKLNESSIKATVEDITKKSIGKYL